MKHLTNVCHLWRVISQKMSSLTRTFETTLHPIQIVKVFCSCIDWSLFMNFSVSVLVLNLHRNMTVRYSLLHRLYCNCVLPTLEHSLSVGHAAVLETGPLPPQDHKSGTVCHLVSDYVGCHTASSGGYWRHFYSDSESVVQCELFLTVPTRNILTYLLIAVWIVNKC